MTAGQEIQHAFHHPAGVRFSRMYPGADNYTKLLTLGNWKRESWRHKKQTEKLDND